MVEETAVEVEEVVEDKVVITQEATVLEDAVAEELLANLRDGFRTWVFENKKYQTRFPTPKEEGAARWEYARAFNKALAEGLPTQKEMRDTLKKRGVWTDAEEEKVSELRNKIVQLETILAKKNVKDKSKKTAGFVEELLEARTSLLELTGTLSDYMNQTVEAISDETRTAVLIAAVTETAEGEPVWETHEDYLSDKHTNLVSTATYQYMTFSNGLPEDYIAQLTEVKFMRAGRDGDAE